MIIHLAFSESHDNKFIVLCAAESEYPRDVSAGPRNYTFEDENSFLKKVVAADLPREYLVSLTTTVLISISRPAFPPKWVSIDVTEAQRVALGLISTDQKGRAAKPSFDDSQRFPISNVDNARELHDFLMEAPSPFMMMKGPEHVLTFINPPYVELLHRDLHQRLLGLPVRELLPELEGQPFYDLLDEVYRTGVPYVGKEVVCRLHNQRTGEMEDHYCDFVYYPAHDRSGTVFGIFTQAFDVTERVLARQVSTSREAQLYRQWAEMDNMYRTAPVAMCLVDSKQHRILRINDKMATLTGESAEDLIGQKILEVFPGISDAEKPLLKAAKGEYVRNFEITTSVRSMPGILRQWLVSYGPLRGAGGEVEAIACVSLEVTDRIGGHEENVPKDGASSAEILDAKS